MNLSPAERVLRKLYEGQRIRISFETSAKRETFRKAIYQKKKEQDESLKILLGEEKKLLRIKIDSIGYPFYLTCWLEAPKETFLSFEVLEKEDASLPTNLA